MAPTGSSPGGDRIQVEREIDLDGSVRGFSLTFGAETIRLEPNKSWIHTDHFKWVTRGLIEEPQSFHVHKDGTVDINGETIRLDDPESEEKLDRQINKRHELPGSRPAGFMPALRPPSPPATPSQPGRVHFRVRLDTLGHVIVEAHSGGEKVETGLKGLHTLVQNGLLLPPGQFHLDPLQTHLELDGTRFECNAGGIQLLEETLNARYAPTIQDARERGIEIKENPASPTGFDIHFVSVRAGARFDVKGHLTQAELDVLQDPNKCDLLVRGTILKLSPPHLLIRRKRPDGGEERIPGIPDVQYLRSTALQLQELFNHPLLRQHHAEHGLAELEPGDLVRLRVTRHPGDGERLWIEGDTVPHTHFESRAFTHHNLADLQRRGCFQSHLSVTCSLDNSVLGLLDTRSGTEEKIRLGPQAGDAELQAAGLMLTNALHPPRHPPEPSIARAPHPPAPLPSTPQPVHALPAQPREGSPRAPADRPQAAGAANSPHPTPASAPEPAKPQHPPPPGLVPAPPAPAAVTPAAQPSPDPAIVALFDGYDPWRTNEEVFRSLTTHFALPVQDVLFSLPRVFEDRRFEILPLENQAIESVLDLRGPEFYGFYLAHIGAERIDLVYACRGVHIEWGTDKCVLQTSLHTEAVEFRQSGLRGVALTEDNRFAFVVTDAYRAWIRPHELAAGAAMARFLTVPDIASEPELYTFIWPPRSAPGTPA